RLCDATAAARIGGALGRSRIGFHRLICRGFFWLFAARRTDNDLSGGGCFFDHGRRCRRGGRLITSWTLIGYTRALVWELPFFGADFVIWRIVEALPLPIIA